MAKADTVRGALRPHAGHGFFLAASLNEVSNSNVSSQVKQ
jgi:hypothetical protein